MSYARFIPIILLLSAIGAKAQCGGGTSSGTVTPTSSWQTSCVPGGNYLSFSATKGVTYTFSFCQGGGSFTFDTQITINDNAGTIVSGAYNDDYCGLGSQLTFIAPATATYRVLITEWNCAINATCQTLAYRTSPPVNDDLCGATFIYGYSCAPKYYIGTNIGATNSAPGNPSCASYGGQDVWFATKVPSSGRIIVNTDVDAGSALTDGGLAIYRANSCGSALTGIECDDDDGAGNMSMIDRSGLTPGDTVFIRVWTYGGGGVTGTFQISVHDGAPYYCMAGQASELNPGNCIEITPNKNAQIGCIWNTTQLNLSSAFDYTYTVNLGNNDAGADGVTFTLQNSAAGTSACGSPGYQLASSPIPNSLTLEFDTYNNGGASEMVADHCAISVNGNILSPVAGPIQASATNVNIEDGLDHTVRVTWDPVTDVISVYLDGVFRLSYNSDIITTIFGGSSMVYWGFTGSTGAYTNTQIMCPGNLPGAPLPVQWLSFNAYMLNDHAYLNWNTDAQKNIDRFEIERSTNGSSFLTIGSVAPQSGSTAAYQYIDNSPLGGTSYYRIKEVDINGVASYSTTRSVTAGESSQAFFQLYPNPASPNEEIFVDIREAGSIEIVDALGNVVYIQELKKGLNTINSGNIANGAYTCVVKNENTTRSTLLIVAN